MAGTLTRPNRIDWKAAILQMHAKGCSLEDMALFVGVSSTTVWGWKNIDAEPKHADGERLLSMWAHVTGQSLDQAPRTGEQRVSAAWTRYKRGRFSGFQSD